MKQPAAADWKWTTMHEFSKDSSCCFIKWHTYRKQSFAALSTIIPNRLHRTVTIATATGEHGLIRITFNQVVGYATVLAVTVWQIFSCSATGKIVVIRRMPFHGNAGYLWTRYYCDRLPYLVECCLIQCWLFGQLTALTVLHDWETLMIHV